LRDDAVGLADAFDHEDHAEIEHQMADCRASSSDGVTGGGG